MKHKMNFAQISRTAWWLGLIVFTCFAAARAQTTAFTYQGRFTDSSQTQPTNGNYNMQFALFDAASAPVGSAITVPSVQIVNGIFTVKLDFGAAAFPANAERLLEIRVFNPATSLYVPLSPRQPLTSAPFAIRSKTATTADVSTDTLNVGQTPAAQIIKEGDARLTDTRTPTAGSANYIQNQNAAAQTSSNFNISGTGAANVFNAATQFDIGGGRVFGVPGSDNTFAGFNTGTVNAGISNSFFGRNSGSMNTLGGNNSFVGRDAGRNSSTGAANSFFGVNAGLNNLSGSENVFVGVQAGTSNITGSNNTVIGTSANVSGSDRTFATAIGSGAVVGANNTVVLGRGADTVQIPGTLNVSVVNAATQFNLGGSRVLLVTTPATGNTFVGRGAGLSNPTGGQNTFLGEDAGRGTTTGGSNVFAGWNAGYSNTSGFDNSFVGRNVGFMNTGGSGNSFYGRNAGFSNTTGIQNVFFGRDAGYDNLIGGENAFVGTDAGSNNTTGSGNSFFGTSAGTGNTTGNNNTIIGNSANVNNLRSFATALGAFAIVGASDTIVLGKAAGTYNSEARPADSVRIPGNLSVNGAIDTGAQYNIGGTRVLSVPGGTNVFVGANAGSFNVSGSNNTVIGANADFSGGANNLIYATAIGADAQAFESNSIVLGRGNASDTVRIPGKVKLNTFGSAGADNLCFNAGLEISTCSSSLRYKTNIAPFNFGLNLVNRLKPITFDWKDGGMHDLGLGAEDVAAIEPLLVTYNKTGQIEGVKYDRIGVVLLNAVKEQQTQIEAQAKQIEAQRLLIEGLKQIVCANNPNAAVCQ